MSLAGARVQPLVAIPTLLFVPGYLLIAILFPGGADGAVSRSKERERRGLRSSTTLDTVERLSLSFGMSIALVPVFALIIGAEWVLTPPTVLNGFSALTVAGVGIATILRLRQPRENDARLSIQRMPVGIRRRLFKPEDTSTVDAATTLVLVLAILAAVGAAGYAIATPYQSPSSSTLYLVTANEGEPPIASGYPTNFSAGEGQSLTVGIANDEEHRQSYTIVITLERVRIEETATTIIESQELDRLHPVVAAGQTWTGRHTVVPEMVGEDLRLHYYLYKGQTAPVEPTRTSAYRDTYLWITVQEG